MGRVRYPQARRLLITADCGGSNGARVRLWKRELQALANELGLSITVCHLPPGTSKWNRIEHRLFSLITQNWRGKPLVSYHRAADRRDHHPHRPGGAVCHPRYPAGVKVSGAEMADLKLTPYAFHGE